MTRTITDGGGGTPVDETRPSVVSPFLIGYFLGVLFSAAAFAAAWLALR